MSVRLTHVLQRAKVRLLGDLHGLTFESLAKSRHCGVKTIRELAQIVAAAKKNARDPAFPAVNGSASPALEFTVPERVRRLALADLPVTKRLEHLFQTLHVSRLGQLHGRSSSEFLEHKNCGVKTIRELQELISRAAAGEFDAAASHQNGAPAELLGLIEAALARLDQRDRVLMLARLGKTGASPPNLAKIGRRLGLSRERVRQVEGLAAAAIRMTWGPRIPALLEALRERCLSALLPLTPALLAAWLGDDPPEFTLTPPAQLRLIGLLDERMPCWPDADDGRGGFEEKTSPVERDLGEILLGAGGRLPLAEAFLRLRQQRGQTRLDPTVFLAGVRRARQLRVEFPAPENPVLRLLRASAPALAASIVADSIRPLRAHEIHHLAIRRFGREMVRFGPSFVGQALTEVPAVYTLGSGLYGTQRHFHLAPRKWKEVRDAFVGLLERAKRPISAYEVVQDRLMPSLSRDVNAHEVASALRDDPRLTNLGLLFFSLARWEPKRGG